MKKLLTSFFLILVGLTQSISQNLNTQNEETSITFKIKNFGLYVDGSFSEFKVNANFDKTNISNSYFSGTAVVGSIDTGNKTRDKHLQKLEYFNTTEFPAIAISSNSIQKKDDGGYAFIGELSMKGKTQKLSFPFTIEENSEGIIARGTFSINRLDFKIGDSSFVLNKKVQVALTYVGYFN